MSLSYTLDNVNPETTAEHLVNEYVYKHSKVTTENGKFKILPQSQKYTFKTDVRVPKLGILLVGLGGNNGTTFIGGITANKYQISWNTKKGTQYPNYYGSITQCSTTKVGVMDDQEVYLPLREVLPIVDPNDVIVSGWDISNEDLATSMARAEVFDYDLQQKLVPYMKDIVPMPAIYYEEFIALNQKDRADNILPGNNKADHLETIRNDIRQFKEKNSLDKVVIMWTANTERFCVITPGVHDTAENVLSAIERSEKEISPSTVYAVASILEGCSFINGSPQNTIVPGVEELARREGVYVVGDDFKTGQTKIKTSLIDFLVGAGIRPKSIVSYNHLGNNDGKNLSSESQFKSKEMSKKSCVDDILNSNKTLYRSAANIDHQIVIKYVPSAGDTKKAMDEYISEIFMGGQHTLTLYNVCEDSLLAAPLILDLILLTELLERIEFKKEDQDSYSKFDTVLSILGYLMKAPKIKEGHPMVNALSRQKLAIENLFKACAGIPTEDNLLLEFRTN